MQKCALLQLFQLLKILNMSNSCPNENCLFCQSLRLPVRSPHADRSDKNFNPQNTQCIPVVKILFFVQTLNSVYSYFVPKNIFSPHKSLNGLTALIRQGCLSSLVKKNIALELNFLYHTQVNLLGKKKNLGQESFL